jgi:hypothetical protein
MASKKPLCLYGGNIKQLQPGDALVGAYNATEAGWVVNASGWLVATPGTAKMWDRTVTGSIMPTKSDGIKLMDRNGITIFRTASNDGKGVVIGSAQDPVASINLAIQEKGSGGVWSMYTNDTTGHSAGNGFCTGIDGSELAVFRNYENTDMLFFTNNAQRMALKAGGLASINSASIGIANIASATLPLLHGLTNIYGAPTVSGNTTLSASLFVDGNASIDNDLRVGNDFYAIGNASINGNLDVLGNFVVTGTTVFKDETHYLGDNTFGDAPTDTQTLHGIIIASGPLTCQFTTATGFIVKGNASIDGTLDVGSTLRVYGGGVFNKSVTLSSEVTIEAGKRLYFDGGTDTYITATSNDSIDYVVQNIQMLNMQSAQGIVVGSAVASAVDELHIAGKGQNAHLRITNASTGHAVTDGVLIGVDGTTRTVLYGYDGPWRIMAQGTHVATWGSGGLTMADGDVLAADTIRARDAGGLNLWEDGSAGIAITNDGPIMMNLAASLNNTLTVAATITGNTNVVGSVLGLKAGARLRACTITASGEISNFTGDDLMLSSTDASPNDQQFIAEKVWNAVYNDIVDFQDLAKDGEWKYGKAYFDSYDGARICEERCQKSVIGICSDTFGFAVGKIQGRTQIPVSVSGWALAFVDKAYDSGEPLTNSATGHLTAMTATEKREYPERMVAIYKRPEPEEMWAGKVKVNGRHWVKVR